MHIYCICTTYNRDKCLSRAIRCFIEQDYQDLHTLLVFNTGAETMLEIDHSELSDKQSIILVQRTNSIATGNPYTSVGQKYMDAITYCKEADVVTSFDCDDVFLPHHLSEGSKGMQKAYEQGKLAYKPKYSYFKSAQAISKMENVFEPSIFVDADHVKEHGYLDNSVKYHDGWLHPLIKNDKILVDPNGESTFMYDWSGETGVYKISGRPDTPLNFYMSQNAEKDTGSGVTKPFTKAQIQDVYKEIKDFNYINS